MCEQPCIRNTHTPEVLGPWECTACWSYWVGTQSEYEEMEPHRKARRRLKSEAEARAKEEAAE